jgi:hypothetical protein
MTTRSPQLRNSASGPRWSREQIRAARLAPLVPLLEKRGFQLIEREAGNFTLPAYPVLILKDSDWRWPERDQAGNVIDFFMRILGLSFHDAMRQITGPNGRSGYERNPLLENGRERDGHRGHWGTHELGSVHRSGTRRKPIPHREAFLLLVGALSGQSHQRRQSAQ